MVKQVIAIRKDLNMRKGKMCAQSCHASMKVLLDRMSTIRRSVPVFPVDINTHEITGESISHEVIVKSLMFDLKSPWDEWLNGLFKKIVVGVNSLEEIHSLRIASAINEIPFAVIEDAGRTEFSCKHCDFYVDCCNGNLVEEGCFAPKEMTSRGKCDNITVTTCIAIGPDLSELIDKITGKLELL